MKKLTPYIIRSIAQNWLRLCFNVKLTPLISLELQDHFVLRGGCLKIWWETSGAYVLKVFVDNRFLGYFLPVEHISISAVVPTVVCVKAIGVYEETVVIVRPTITPFAWEEAAKPELKRSILTPPPVLNRLTLKQTLKQPITPRPTLINGNYTLDTPKAKKDRMRLEKEMIAQLNVHS